MGHLEKRRQVYLWEKEVEAITANWKNDVHDAENLELVPVLEVTSKKESTKDQELVNCTKVYDRAVYYRRQICATIKKNKVNKPAYFQIRLFTAKENEALKQIAYINYTVNEFKDLSQILEHFMFAELRTLIYNKFCYLCFFCLVIRMIIFKNHFSFSVWFEKYDLKYWFLRQFVFKTGFLDFLKYCSSIKVSKILLTDIASQNIPKLQNLDLDSDIYQLE